MARSPTLAPFDSTVLDLVTRYLSGWQPALGAGTMEAGEAAYLDGLAAEARDHLTRHPISERGRVILEAFARQS